MIELDVEYLVLSGQMKEVDHATTRGALISLLGPDESNYPDIVGYGHVGFDFPGGSDQLRGVTISFPQYFKSPSFERQEQIRYLRNWPDHRFHWKMGRIKIDSTVEQIRESLPDLSEWTCLNDLSNAFGGGCSLQSKTSPTSIHFQSYSDSDPMIIDWIQTYVRP